MHQCFYFQGFHIYIYIYYSTMNASDGEFLAERELIEIIPNYNHDKLFLISGDVGPFVAGLLIFRV